MGSTLGLKLIEPGWLPFLSPEQTPLPHAPSCSGQCLFWERALKSADEKGRDNSISTDKNKVGIFKMSVDKGVILAEQEFPAMKNVRTNPLNHERKWIDIWVKQSWLILKPTFLHQSSSEGQPASSPITLSRHRKVDEGGKQLFRLSTNNDKKIRSWLVFIACLGHHSHSLNKKLNYKFTLEDSFAPSYCAEAASWSAACSQSICSSQSESQWGIALLLPRLELIVTVQHQLCTPALKGSTIPQAPQCSSATRMLLNCWQGSTSHIFLQELVNLCSFILHHILPLMPTPPSELIYS